MKNWEIIDGEYTRKVMWINHEIEMKLYYNGEDEIDENEVDEIKEARKLAYSKKAYVAVRLDENKVARYVKITKEKTDEKDLLFIAYKTDGFNVDINANSYLFQEGTGDKYQNAVYSKVVLVGENLRLIDLRDKDFKEIK